MTDRSGRFVLGVILILLGVIFFLPSLHIPRIGWGSIWPLFIALGGIAFLAGWAVAPEHEPGLAFVGAGGLFVGAFLALFAWEIIPWQEMSIWWPAFPFLGGLAFLVLWAAGRGTEPGILVPACGGLLTGVVAFLFTRGLVGVEIAAKWWPLILIGLGILVLLRQLVNRRGA